MKARATKNTDGTDGQETAKVQGADCMSFLRLVQLLPSLPAEAAPGKFQCNPGPGGVYWAFALTETARNTKFTKNDAYCRWANWSAACVAWFSFVIVVTFVSFVVNSSGWSGRMCWAVPARIIDINGQVGKVEISGTVRQVGLQFIPEPQVGEYVLIHAGFAIQKMDEGEAQETLDLLAEMFSPPRAPRTQR